MQELGNVINIYRETEVSLLNFQQILDTPRDRKPASPEPVDELMTLQFEEVRFQHQTSAALALDGISFSAARGDTIAFVGPSGAGKSTLVKLLVGLYAPKSGNILYSGIPSDRVDLDLLREKIGFVTQDTQLFSGSIRENLLFVNPHATDAECMAVLRQAATHSLLERADRGLDTLIGEGGVKVSGGEKQRLSIARALLRHPQLLVFDEATSSLDSLTEEEISRTIRNVATNQEAITILIAHRLSTVMHAAGSTCSNADTSSNTAATPSYSTKKAFTMRCGANKWANARRSRKQDKEHGASSDVITLNRIDALTAPTLKLLAAGGEGVTT